jgi:hypothetical protein
MLQTKERALRVQIARPRCPKYARQKFAALPRRDHEPAFPGAATFAAYPCRAVPAVHHACNIRCRDEDRAHPVLLHTRSVNTQESLWSAQRSRSGGG